MRRSSGSSGSSATSGSPGRSSRERLARNPFHVLGVAPDAPRIDIERAGQKLLGMLELGLAASQRYPTPLGYQRRTPEDVRWAMAELRDPERRLGHELWAALAPARTATGAAGGDPTSASHARASDDAAVRDEEQRARLAPFDAETALGWTRSP